MRTCPSCAEPNPDHARFCLSCGTALKEPEPERELRKTVTVLFVDLVGSTSMGARLDPETLRRVMERYYELLRGAVEAHGGAVQKFIGDALVAVFGVPVIHEDDALRAVRAALDAARALGDLNEELERDFGVRIETRAGINTGEVVVGSRADGESMVVGDPVNVAARLEQAADPGEVLVGESTYAIVGHAVSAQRLAPLPVKGKDEPLVAFRVDGLVAGATARRRRLQSPLVGRAQELRLIVDAFERARQDRACHLFTVIAPAGVGKSRLSDAAAQESGAALVLRGRCLAYGDGITFWPLAEIVREAAGIQEGDRGEQVARKIEAAVADDPDASAVAGVLADLIGSDSESAAVAREQSFWATRRLFECLSRRTPLMVVFDDIHWAEPTLLDLIEHVADMARDAPILMVCLARPELFDLRPTWGGGKRNATSIQLEPLSSVESVELLENLVGGAELPLDVSLGIASASEGTPLFLEEMIAMLIDSGLIERADGQWSVTGDLSTVPIPPTIQALLAVRLDALAPDERRALEVASVVGKEFWHAAVQALAPPELQERLGTALQALVRKDVIIPERSPVTGGDSFRFRHILIRDAAYEALPKAERATLHERFAGWLEDAFADRLAEVEEIVGYHLEEAHRHRASISASATGTAALAQRAASHLAGAGRRALGRRDLQAATNLLGRAHTLTPAPSQLHRRLGLEIAYAQQQAGEFDEALAVLEEVRASAIHDGDAVSAAHARVDAAQIRISVDPEGAVADGRAEADAALPVFEAHGDHVGIAKALLLAGEHDHMVASWEPWRRANEQALVHLRTAGERLWVRDVLWQIAHTVVFGPVPAEEGLARLEDILAEAPDDRDLRARVRVRMGYLLAMVGRESEAIQAENEAEALLLDLGLEFPLGSFGLIAGNIERVLGRFEHAERRLRLGAEVYERAGERSVRSTVLAVLASVLAWQGRVDEAEATAHLALEIGSTDDYVTVAWADGTLAMVLSARGQPGAVQAAQRSLSLIEQTDMLVAQGEQWEILAKVLLAERRHAEAAAALDQALDRYQRKGATALAARVRSQLTAAPSA